MLEKVNLNQVLAIGIVGLAINVLFVGCGKSSTIDKLQSDTDRNLGTIKAESAILGVEVERIERTTGSVAETIGEANTRINDGRATFNTISTRINDIKNIVGECQRLARENANIIDKADKANQ
ncbi:MAG: hypothetical protein IKT51_02690 [Phascolarctobacterium sp.]|nr:hypothetical protein [Phascolarctobacterium sp.]